MIYWTPKLEWVSCRETVGFREGKEAKMHEICIGNWWRKLKKDAVSYGYSLFDTEEEAEYHLFKLAEVRGWTKESAL